MKTEGLRLHDGARVCIIGGGPAGSFAALHLLHLARRQGLKLELLIFEPRDFSLPGPGGCNRCAGILSSRVLRGLDGLGLALPPAVVQAELDAYALYLDGQVLRIKRPDAQRRIVSVYRGGGPRLLQGEPAVGFDRYLLDQACTQGARHIPFRVRQVSWEGQPVVQGPEGAIPADLLILATGVNGRAPLASEYGYKAPQTEVMAQNEIVRPPSWPDNQVNIYFRKPSGLTFGAMIPKGDYLNISLLGRDLTLDTVNQFMETQGLEHALGSAPVNLCGCTPRVAVRASGAYFGTRWVAVGDAAATRLYKDGIGSAFYTAQQAVQAALTHGISRHGFAKSYAPYCRSVALDNLYGRLLFRMWAHVLQTPRLLHAWTHVVRQEEQWPLARRVHTRILWGMFSGDELYRKLFFLAISPQAVLGLGHSWWNSNR
jgi:flavin-dependent dehydrogenase